MVTALEKILLSRLSIYDLASTKDDYHSIVDGLVGLQNKLIAWVENRMNAIGVDVNPGQVKIWSVNSRILIQHNEQCFELDESCNGGQIDLVLADIDVNNLYQLEHVEEEAGLQGKSPLLNTHVGILHGVKSLCIQLTPNPWEDQVWYQKYLQRNEFEDQSLNNYYPLEVALNYLKIMAKQCRLGDCS